MSPWRPRGRLERTVIPEVEIPADIPTTYGRRTRRDNAHNRERYPMGKPTVTVTCPDGSKVRRQTNNPYKYAVIGYQSGAWKLLSMHHEPHLADRKADEFKAGEVHRRAYQIEQGKRSDPMAQPDDLTDIQVASVDE